MVAATDEGSSPVRETEESERIKVLVNVSSILSDAKWACVGRVGESFAAGIFDS